MTPSYRVTSKCADYFEHEAIHAIPLARQLAHINLPAIFQLLKHPRRFQFEDRATQMGIVCRGGESNRADRLLTAPPLLVAPAPAAVPTFW